MRRRPAPRPSAAATAAAAAQFPHPSAIACADASGDDFMPMRRQGPLQPPPGAHGGAPPAPHASSPPPPPPPPPAYSPGAGARLEAWFGAHADPGGTVDAASLAAALASELLPAGHGEGEKERGGGGEQQQQQQQRGPAVDAATVAAWVARPRSGGGGDPSGIRVSYAQAMGVLSRAAAGEDGAGELAGKSSLVLPPPEEQ